MTGPRPLVEPSSPDMSRAFRALGHPHRLTIVRALVGRAVACCRREREEECSLDPASCNVGELGRLVSIAPSTLSHHLRELCDAGVIERGRKGRFIYCRVNEDLLKALRDVLGGSETGARSPPPSSRRSREARCHASPR